MTFQCTTAEELRAWGARQLELLQLEREAEVEEMSLLATKCSPALLERNGLALNGLGVSSLSTGLGGKTHIELERPMQFHTDPCFPPHTFRTGDLARILPHVPMTSRGAKDKRGKVVSKGSDESATTKGIDGVVSRVSEQRIVLAVGKADGDSDDDISVPERCRLVKIANDVTFYRMEKTLKLLMDRVLPAGAAECVTTDPLTSALLGLSEPRFDETCRKAPIWLDQSLNSSQQEAARFVLQEALDVGLIHGPPGTGKTQTLTEVIRQLVLEGKRVLVCGASNLAVDNLVERLAMHQVPLTRIGHPARVLEALHHVTLDFQVSHSSAAEIVADIKKEMNTIVSDLGKGKLRGKERKEQWNLHKDLRKELRQREGAVVSNVIHQTKVVLATCFGAGGRQLQDQVFDVVVIDEAAQALEAASWIAISRGKKLILAGDPLQLPPTVKSTAPKTKAKIATRSVLKPPHSLHVTLFERLLSAYGKPLKRLLSVQYRMHESIMRFASIELYEGQLEAAESVKAHVLQDLVQEPDETLIEPIIFYDTAGANMYERTDSEDAFSNESKSNENEALLVVRHIRELTDVGINPVDISIITPYAAQVALLSSLIRQTHPGIHVGTVDSFQGRESEVICLSLVRSNEKRDVGFVADSRRLNVAMTRPRRQLVVVGDSETIASGTPYLKRWMNFLEENAEVRPAGIIEL